MINPFVQVMLQRQDVNRWYTFSAWMFDRKIDEIPGIDSTIINFGEERGHRK
jgi:hypothetical protein